MKRRQFIVLAGAGLTLGWLPDPPADAAVAADTAGASPAFPATPFAQPFLRIATDGTLTVIAKHLEMGQGVYTGLASIVAEELDADWSLVRVESASANKALYRHLAFGMQTTGGSTSISGSWDQLRDAGATARAMLLAAAALRFAKPVAELTVREGFVSHPSGVRASFGELADAAAAQPVPASVVRKDPNDYHLFGKDLPRTDTRAKSDGSAVFAGDLTLPGLKVALLIRAPRFGGLVRSFDARDALAIRGVRRVVAIPQDKAKAVAIVADDTWAALKGRRAVKVDWDDGAAETRSSAELVKLYAQGSTSLPAIDALVRGSASEGLARSTRVVSAEYALPYLAHQPMEPLVSSGVVRDGRCDLWAGSQNQTADQAAAAAILGLPLDRVRLQTTFAGGSFGRRATFSADWITELAHVLVATGRRWPVRLMWTREDDIGSGYYRPMVHHRLRAGLGEDGRIVAVEQTIVAQSFLFPAPAEGVAPAKADPLVVDGAFPLRYDFPDATVRWVYPRVGVPVQMFRGLALNHTTFTKEVFIDELARAAGIDPVAYRLMHLDASSVPRSRQANVLRIAADRAGWGQPRDPGVALGVAVQEAEGSFVAQVAQVRLVDGAPHVERVTCAIDCGRALNPEVIRAQVESGVAFGLSTALYSGITLAAGKVTQTNFHDQQVVRMPQMPRSVETHIVESDRAPTGVGEPGSVCIAAAVANAFAVLTGKPVRGLPLVAAG